MMVEIEQELLKHLICSKCDSYLSIAPIYLQKDSKNVCGRCSLSDSEKNVSFRNDIFEKVVSKFIFPCKFDINGCKEKLDMEDMKKHEEICYFSMYKCPMMEDSEMCTWVGQKEDLQKHLMQDHSESLSDHPFTYNSHSQDDVYKNFWLSIYGFIFIIQIKYDNSVSKMYHRVHFLGDPSTADLFTYNLKITGNKGILSQKCCVHLQAQFSADCIETNSTALQDLIGPIENLKFIISIMMNNIRCQSCNSEIKCAPIHQSNDSYKCDKCVDFESSTSSLYSGVFVPVSQLMRRASEHNLTCKYYPRCTFRTSQGSLKFKHEEKCPARRSCFCDQCTICNYEYVHYD